MSPSSETEYSATAKSRSHVSWRCALSTRPLESGFHEIELCSNSPGVRLRGALVPSAATTYRWLGRSKIQPSLSSLLKNLSTLRGACQVSSSAAYRSCGVRLTKAIQRPSGLHDTSSMPSFIVAIVRVSPGASTGSTCSVASPFLTPRLDANANDRPSGLHAGAVSWSPFVTALGADAPSVAASQICERFLFFAMSTRTTSNATVDPSGDTAGPLA